METHPVPQNISSYEFRLVGDMTLKQFLQLAGGIIVAVIIFRLPLIAIIKFPLTFISALLGVLMAFVPVNGRPFSTWFFAFIKAIYSPTQYVWSPLPETPVQTAITAPTLPLPTTSSTQVGPSVVSSFTSYVASKLPNISPPGPTEMTSAVITIDTPKAQPKPEESAPAKTQVLPENPVPEPKSKPQPPSPTTPDTAPAGSAPQTVSQPAAPQSTSVSTAPGAASTSLVSPPTNPNILAGLVTDAKNQPLNGITVEIIDTATGIPARALRTNRLGQFQIAIPLAPGTYNLLAEKEGLSFDPVSIQVKGSIIPPVVISAKS